MSTSTTAPEIRTDWPDHTQLPDKDGVPVMNSLEQPQNALLSEILEPVLRQLHPDGRYFLGRDTGLYWRPTTPPMLGCKSPDWYYVPDVDATLDGMRRRSYVLWREGVVPQVTLEYASGDGTEERDQTPEQGKFWVYEHIGIAVYGIFLDDPPQLEVYYLVDGHYQLTAANEHGRYFIPPLGVELGVWHGSFENYEAENWLRWWDTEGNMLPTKSEIAEQLRQQSERLAAKLRELGIDPNTV